MTGPDDAEAKRIYQELLDKIGQSYFDADFAYFRDVIHVPHTLHSQGQTVHVDTDEDLRAGFNKFRSYLAGIGVTEFIRTCEDAMFLNEQQIIGEHTSHLLRNGVWSREPYNVRSMLRRTDGRWQVCSSENALPDSAWQIMAMAPRSAKTKIARAAGIRKQNSKTGESND
ncbi:hypothetical protein [Yoonia sp. SS1-5]|uniref:SnoaL-like domain-containing protein n=1 Tax=Yoonia rhodophyticola TaxID=3137370 RepID=A0AAN0NKJ7_9RHOB